MKTFYQEERRNKDWEAGEQLGISRSQRKLRMVRGQRQRSGCGGAHIILKAVKELGFYYMNNGSHQYILSLSNAYYSMSFREINVAFSRRVRLEVGKIY